MNDLNFSLASHADCVHSPVAGLAQLPQYHTVSGSAAHGIHSLFFEAIRKGAD